MGTIEAEETYVGGKPRYRWKSKGGRGTKKTPKKRGPKTNHLKIDEGWEDAVKTAIQKKKPKDGWPKKGK